MMAGRCCPPPRFAASVASVRDKVYLWGGKVDCGTRESETEKVYMYDINTEIWQQKVTRSYLRTMFPLSGCGYSSVGQYIYIYGGHDGVSYSQILYKLDTHESTWSILSCFSPAGPAMKEGCGVIPYKDQIIVFGGWCDQLDLVQPGSRYEEKKTNEIHCFDLKHESWSSLPSGKGSFRPPPCAYFSLTKIDEENAVMFGGHLSGIDYSANVYTLKLSDMNWSCLPHKSHPSPEGRNSHIAICLGYDEPYRRVLISGGQSGRKVLSDTWLLDPLSGNWQEVKVLNNRILHRYGHSAASLAINPNCIEVVMFGGRSSEEGPLLQQTAVLRFELDFSRSTWILTDVADNAQLGSEKRVDEKTRMTSSSFCLNQGNETKVKVQEKGNRKKEVTMVTTDETWTILVDGDERVKQLQQQLEENEKISQQLSIELNNSKKEVETYKKKAEYSTKQVEELEKEAKEFGKKINKSNKKAKESKRMSYDSNKRAEEAATRVEELERRMLESEREVEELKRRQEESAKKAEESARKAEESDKRAEEVSKKTDESERLLVEYKKKAEELQGIAEKSVRIAGEVKKKAEESDRLEAEIERKQVEFERKLEESDKRAEDLKLEVNEANKMVEQFEKKAEESKRQAEAFSEIRRLEHQRATEARKSLGEVTERLRACQDRLQAYDTQWVVSREEIELGCELGRGAWATVCVAMFRGAQVAAKKIHDQIICRHNINLFRREMNMAARLRHPNLVQFIGATVEGDMMILTELMSTSLRKQLQSEEYFQPKLVKSLSLDVTRALSYLHQMQPDPIMHRDISSANVLLEPLSICQWRAKVTDYGSVNIVRQLKTENPGCPAYSAPEASNIQCQSPKMDIYSFGALMLEMLTGQLPAPEDRPTLLCQVHHELFLRLIRRCLNENPKDRPDATVIINELN